MSEAKALAAFERLDRTRAVALLRFMADKVGCEVRDPQSDSATKRARQRRDRPTTAPRQRHDSATTAPVLSEITPAAPLVNSDLVGKKVAAKKTTRKPKVSVQPTQDEIRVIRSLNVQRQRLIPDDLGYDAGDSSNIADLRKVLIRFTVADCETVIEWWPTRKGSFPGWKAIDHLRPATVFNGKKFPDYVNRARAWKVGRDDIEYDNDALWRETMARGET